MASLITPEGRERQKRKHERTAPVGPHKLPAYGLSGWKWRADVLALVERVGARSVLDYGAGKGTLAAATIGDGLRVSCYDPITFPDKPKPADVVVCTDVLEHVEPDCLDAVLAHIHALARKAVLIAVPRHRAEKAAPGFALEAPEWWRQRLAAYWPRHEASVVRWTIKEEFVPCDPDSEIHTPRLRFIGFA